MSSENNYRNSFATVLRRQRGALGISQEELAARAGITMRYVSLLETERKQPTLETLFGLSRGLETSFAQFASAIEVEYLKTNEH